MTGYVLRRLAMIPVALLLVNFLGFAYAHFVWPVQSAANPLMAATAEAAPSCHPISIMWAAGCASISARCRPRARQSCRPRPQLRWRALA